MTSEQEAREKSEAAWYEVNLANIKGILCIFAGFIVERDSSGCLRDVDLVLISLAKTAGVRA